MIRTQLGLMYRTKQRRRIFERFSDFTMIDIQTYCDNLHLAERVKSLPGCIVECGVWKGGMSAGIATVLGPSRTYYLFDSFEGLPPAQNIDGEAAQQWQLDTKSASYFENCAADESFASEAMSRSGVPKFRLVKGWFENTLPGFQFDEPIALLRLDGDWYDSTIQCLENLFHRVAVGGLILIDDYHAWDGCSRAVHDFLSKTVATERIKNLNQVCYLERQANLPQ